MLNNQTLKISTEFVYFFAIVTNKQYYRLATVGSLIQYVAMVSSSIIVWEVFVPHLVFEAIFVVCIYMESLELIVAEQV